MDYREGDRILARWDGGDFWFAGRVHSTASDGSVAILYDDGMSDIRPPDQVKPFDWKVASRIEAIWSGNGRWYSAWLMGLAPDGRTAEIRFDDGIRETRDTAQCRSR